jgi:hypothetical protein
MDERDKDEGGKRQKEGRSILFSSPNFDAKGHEKI